MTIPTTRTTVWLCLSCGYAMDSASPIDKGRARPKDGDLSMCLSCAAPYELRAGKWQPISQLEIDALPADVRELLTRAQRARRELGDKIKVTWTGGKA
jgi:hypothetical protein